MQPLFTDQAISMSAFQSNPLSVLHWDNPYPVAVVDDNKPSFYMVKPQMFELLLDAVADRDLERLVLERMAEESQSFEVDIDKI